MPLKTKIELAVSIIAFLAIAAVVFVRLLKEAETVTDDRYLEPDESSDCHVKTFILREIGDDKMIEPGELD